MLTASCVEGFPPWSTRSPRRSARRAFLPALRVAAVEPFPCACAFAGFGVPGLARLIAATGPDRAELRRELVGGLGIFAAPADFLGTRRVENPADFLDQVFGQTRFGDERV